jgi:hypothetical protein
MANLENFNLKLDDLTIPSQTQGIIELGDLLSLLTRSQVPCWTQDESKLVKQ